MMIMALKMNMLLQQVQAQITIKKIILTLLIILIIIMMYMSRHHIMKLCQEVTQNNGRQQYKKN